MAELRKRKNQILFANASDTDIGQYFGSFENEKLINFVPKLDEFWKQHVCKPLNDYDGKKGGNSDLMKNAANKARTKPNDLGDIWRSALADLRAATSIQSVSFGAFGDAQSKSAAQEFYGAVYDPAIGSEKNPYTDVDTADKAVAFSDSWRDANQCFAQVLTEAIHRFENDTYAHLEIYYNCTKDLKSDMEKRIKKTVRLANFSSPFDSAANSKWLGSLAAAISNISTLFLKRLGSLEQSVLALSARYREVPINYKSWLAWNEQVVALLAKLASQLEPSPR